MTANQCIKSMEFLSGRLCLDFVNTCEYRDPKKGTPINDFLVEPDSVREFLERTKVIEEPRIRRIYREEEHLYKAAIALREFLYETFNKFQRDEGKTSPKIVQELNNWIARIKIRQEVGTDPKGVVELKIQYDEHHPLSLLSPILMSAIELLGHDDPERLRTCPADDCGWFFYDTSKSGKRVWCDMSDCGNREKARRFYENHA